MPVLVAMVVVSSAGRLGIGPVIVLETHQVGVVVQWLLQLHPLVRLARKTNQSLKCLCADVPCHSQQQCSQFARKGRTLVASSTNAGNAISFSGRLQSQVGVVVLETNQ